MEEEQEGEEEVTPAKKETAKKEQSPIGKKKTVVKESAKKEKEEKVEKPKEEKNQTPVRSKPPPITTANLDGGELKQKLFDDKAERIAAQNWEESPKPAGNNNKRLQQENALSADPGGQKDPNIFNSVNKAKPSPFNPSQQKIDEKTSLLNIDKFLLDS